MRKGGRQPDEKDRRPCLAACVTPSAGWRRGGCEGWRARAKAFFPSPRFCSPAGSAQLPPTPPLDAMSLPQFTPQMLHALAQPSSQASHQPPASRQQQQQQRDPAVFHLHQQQQPPVAPPGAVLSSTAQAAAAISAYLSGAASIVFPSQQAAADYQAAAVARAAGAGGPAGSTGIDNGLAWRQARAIEALLLQSGHQQQQPQQQWPFAGWQHQQHQQTFYGAALQSLASQQKQQQQQVYGLMQQSQQQQSMPQFGSYPSQIGGLPSGSAPYGVSDPSPALAFVAAALSPPAMTPQTCSSSGDSSASSPLLSVASLSSSAAGTGLHLGGGGGPPIIYSASPSTGDPFELAPPSNGSEGLGFKDLFGFSPAVALGGSFAAGPPTVQQQTQQQINECVPFFDFSADACLFDPPGPDDLVSLVMTLSVDSAPYMFNALPADATSSYSSASPASNSGMSAVSPSLSVPAKQPTQAELAQAAAAHFAWNQSVNLRDPKKRHVCAVCARGFARAFNLKSHMATHDQNRPKPFTCPHEGCGRGFSRSHDLERHRVGIHQGESSNLSSADPFQARYAYTRTSGLFLKDVGDDLGLVGDADSSSSGSSTASASSSNAQDSKHTATQRVKKRSIRGVSSAA